MIINKILTVKDNITQIDYPYEKVIKDVSGVEQRKIQLRRAVTRCIKNQIKEIIYRSGNNARN